MRSLLFAPADNRAKLTEVLESGADGVLLDLAGSVASRSKSEARKQACAFIAAAKAKAHHPLIFVRLNELDTEMIEADLDAILRARPDGVVLPDAQNGQAVQHLGAKLAVMEAELGLADGSTLIIAGVAGTAASIFNMGTFPDASPRLAGLVWSAEDLSTSLGASARRAPDGSYASPHALARDLTLFAARAADVPLIDGPTLNCRDAACFQLECEAAQRDGFDGKIARDREQVAAINAVFTPPEQVLARARAIIEAFAAEPDARVLAFQGETLNPAHLAQARRLLRRLPSRR